MRKSFFLTALILASFVSPTFAEISPLEDTAAFSNAPKVAKELKDQMFVMETLPPNMRPKPSIKKDSTSGRWMIGHTWKPGTTVRVGFYGGKPEWYKFVAETAKDWTNYGNIKLDFGDQSSGSYRQWSPSDTDYVADIRIGFVGGDGHWSAVGTDSISGARANERSMNLGFENEPQWRWKRVVLHEFGHALGFGHEHQHPNGFCDNEFLWNDEPGYQLTWQWVGPEVDDILYVKDANGKKPGLYKRMIGAPNKWSNGMLDAQMRQMTQQSAYQRGFTPGPVDRKSIMHYGFDESYFKNGKDSPCCIVEADVISEVDKQGMAKFYP
ncbi:MAG: hypothetical protein K2Z81_16450 [Cyanobacteria bacterium]|nr:hypothetical protein [Cyanobacteriota bacterium]